MIDRVRQRELVGREIHFDDEKRYAKYVLPFFASSWRVQFVVLDELGGRPRLWRGNVEVWPGEILIAGSAKDAPLLETIDPARFERMLHFDPWWALRGIGLPDRVTHAAVKTNLASRSVDIGGKRTITDVAFDRSLQTLLAVETKDASFRAKSFGPGELDLAPLTGP